jgi:eukaryotic-like serine/threonine-protein kinase
MSEILEAPEEAYGTPSTVAGSVVAGTYRVGARLGSGGMGDVFEAEHVRLGRTVAVKFLRTDGLTEPRAARRFRQEAKRLAAVQSDNVVSVYDCGELEGGTPYLVMERLYGEDLRVLLRRNRTLPIRRAVRLMIDTCHGLAAIHAAGLVHRDLKPSNLFVVPTRSGGERCKILDFGVAKASASDGTRPGVLLGTLRYMAPEQLEDAASVGPAADLYAVGAILYECLAGVPAHSGDTAQEIMFDMLHRTRRPLSDFCVVPAELERILRAALSREQNQRFHSAEQLASALAPFGAVDHAPSRGADLSSDTVVDAMDSRVLPRPRRSQLPRRGVAGMLLGLGVATSIWAAQSRGKPNARGAATASTNAVCPPAASVVEPPRAETARLASAPQDRAREAPSLRVAASATTSQGAEPRRPRRAAPPPPVRERASDDSEERLGKRFDSNNPYE